MSCAQSSEENPDRGWRQVGLPAEDGPTKDLHLFPMVQVGDKTYLHGGVQEVKQSGQPNVLVQAHPANVWPSLSWSKIEYPESRKNGGFNQYGHVLVWTGEYFLAYGGARGRSSRGTGERYALVRWDLAGESLTQTRLPGDVDERTGTWPLHRAFMAGVWDTANKVMLIFGGALTLESEIRVTDDRQVDELWEYDPLTPTWTDLTATSKSNSTEFPAARRLPNAFWDSIGNRMIVARLQVYGGISGAVFGTFTMHEDLWAYSRSFNRWHKIVQNDPLPPARWAAQVAWTGAGLLVFGGLTNYSSTRDGWWEFSIASGTWQEIWPRDPGLDAAGLFAGGATNGGTATFEPCRKAMLIHGGGTFSFFTAVSLGTVEFRLGVDA
ncbi:unnamed protein product [Symbiodinium necroappetens]|uniref:Uncharacterized protein n=1 Tax=Symbiodinium necroappetens TaxID=1628268 RepID=A0A813BYR1_9DINO|nr:unnamed protein product [Symbiodinium necroappetens]